MLRKLNTSRVYSYLYSAGHSSKLEIAQALSLSIPTVGANIKELMDEGLISIYGEAESTGGRKAQVFSFNSMSRVAIGVELLDIRVRIMASDLYGEKISEETLDLPFENNEAYYITLGSEINSFAGALDIDPEKILGVCITVQGFVSEDGESITYSGILNVTGIERSRFQKYISYPCMLVHDTDAAALAETWKKDDLKDVFFIALNRHIGGKFILANDHKVKNGMIEHMTLKEDGPLCYCGKHGCFETFCSEKSLQLQSGRTTEEFFSSLRSNSADSIAIWNTYLDNLARAISNIRMIIDCEIILGGVILQYMDEADIKALKKKVNELCAIREYGDVRFIISTLGEYANQRGACLYLIDNFFNNLQ